MESLDIRGLRAANPRPHWSLELGTNMIKLGAVGSGRLVILLDWNIEAFRELYCA